MSSTVLPVSEREARVPLPARYASAWRPMFQDAIRERLTLGATVLDIGSGRHPSLSAAERPGTRWGVNMLSPKTANANTQGLMLYVDDVDAHCAQARAAGATIVDEPSVHDYGEDYWADRSYGALDPEGHIWWFSQRLRGPK